MLADEVRRGRVLHEHGRYRLADECFDPAVLAALREIGPEDVDKSRFVPRDRLGARAL